ncbi:MAG: FkbM family methyltransferase [Flavobacteriaceae bacterium]
MKLRHIAEMLGFRAPPRRYGYDVEDFDLGDEGTIRYAQWQHPKNRPMRFEPAAIAELKRYIAPGDTVIDIGAHSGDTSVMFALAAGPKGRVFAVEPNSYVLPILEANASLNPRIAPIEILPYAATAAPGKLVFRYSDAGFCNGGDLAAADIGRHRHYYELAVEGRNIADELAARAPESLERLRLIKSDTEGNDASVIASLRPLIDRHRPYLICEFYRHMDEASRRDFHRLLSGDLGYTVHLAGLWDGLAGEVLGPGDLMREEHFDVFCVPA